MKERSFVLCSLCAVDGNKVVSNDEKHGDAAESVRECGELHVVDHLYEKVEKG